MHRLLVLPGSLYVTRCCHCGIQRASGWAIINGPNKRLKFNRVGQVVVTALSMPATALPI
jgi:hypothetical protein